MPQVKLFLFKRISIIVGLSFLDSVNLGIPWYLLIRQDLSSGWFKLTDSCKTFGSLCFVSLNFEVLSIYNVRRFKAGPMNDFRREVTPL